MTFNQVNRTLQKNRGELSELQNQAATLKRVTKPSDDPLAATRVLTFRTEAQANQQFLKSGNQARALLDFSEQSLSELTNVLNRSKELVMSQVNDASSSASTRRLVAEEMGQLFQQAVQIGNRKLGDRFLFGGYQTSVTPFNFNGQYQGDDGEIRVAINKDAYLATNIPGSKIFMGKQILDHQVGDESVVQPRDVAELQKAEEHFREQKELEKEAQEKGLEKPVPVRGPASIVDPETGEVLKKQGGGFSQRIVEGVNIFELLNDIHISMKADDKRSLQDSLNTLDEAHSQVVMARSELGARINTLEANIESIKKQSVDARGVASELEDADQFEVITDINKTEGALKATLQTSGKLIQPSLLDFLR